MDSYLVTGRGSPPAEDDLRVGIADCHADLSLRGVTEGALCKQAELHHVWGLEDLMLRCLGCYGRLMDIRDDLGEAFVHPDHFNSVARVTGGCAALVRHVSKR